MGVLKSLRSGVSADLAVHDWPDPLEGLLLRAARGDQAAFGEFYDAIGGLVYGIVLKVVRDPSMSEEVTQEVFVELWRLAPRYDSSKGSVKSWAATLAHRRAIDLVRSVQSARNRIDKQVSNIAIDHDVVADTVVDAAAQTFDQARVRRALNRLTELQREAIELTYFGGHTYREAAVLLNVAEGTIKTRIRDGLIRLRDELGATNE